MILIADSGSTKTDWRLMNENGKTTSFETIGFNPYFITSQSIFNELLGSDLKAVKDIVTQIYFYAAGCRSEENKHILKESLANFFSNANIEVEHDMLAAARATCGDKKGVAAILGTGSNSCLFNGKIIIENVTALGFILGDYGSGADLGKTFIKAFLENELPAEIEKDFNKEYNLSTPEILASIYKQELPNRFLAGFSLFIHQHLNNAAIEKMVVHRFELFFEKNICRYSNYKTNPLHLVGSVAFAYQAILKKIAQKYNVEIDEIIKQPIEGLVKYHCSGL